MIKQTAGIDVLAGKKNDTLENGTEAAKAIMTTDTCEKELGACHRSRRQQVTIGGMAKGSGMIHSQYVHHAGICYHDAVIAKETLQKALSGGCG